MTITGYKVTSAEVLQLYYICTMVVWDQYLKAELGTAQVSLVFLPECVRFDEQRSVNVGGESLLKCPQHWLHAVPFTAAHVHYYGKAPTSDVFAVNDIQDRDEIR